MQASTSSLLRAPWILGQRVSADRRSNARPRRAHVAVRAFEDAGHLTYYERAEEEERRSSSRRAKLAEAVSRDLKALVGVGFGVEEDQDKISLSEAAGVLLAQLEKVRANEDDMKKVVKKGDKSMKKMKMKDCDDSSSSSSESSDSSGSECDEEDVVNMSSLRTVSTVDITSGPSGSLAVDSQLTKNDMKEKIKKEDKSMKKMKMKNCDEESSESSDSECDEENLVSMSSLRTATTVDITTGSSAPDCQLTKNDMMKKVKKEDKSMKKMKTKNCDDSSSSSSESSGSSDGECDEDAVNMSSLRTASTVDIKSGCLAADCQLTKNDVKKKVKKEDKSMKKMKTKNCDDSSSSSSESSGSSDSECDEDVVNMSSLRTVSTVDITSGSVAVDNQLTKNEEHKMILVSSGSSIAAERFLPSTCNAITDASCVKTGTMEPRLPSLPPPPPPPFGFTERIEVCMGGKCKKSGAMQLMEEFERHVGGAGMVVGCKCMGKCKEGPNVRVKSHRSDDEKPRNPLCIGVGLEDVGAIVSNYLGERTLGGIQPCRA